MKNWSPFLPLKWYYPLIYKILAIAAELGLFKNYKFLFLRGFNFFHKKHSFFVSILSYKNLICLQCSITCDIKVKCELESI